MWVAFVRASQYNANSPASISLLLTFKLWTSPFVFFLPLSTAEQWTTWRMETWLSIVWRVRVTSAVERKKFWYKIPCFWDSSDPERDYIVIEKSEALVQNLNLAVVQLKFVKLWCWKFPTTNIGLTLLVKFLVIPSDKYDPSILRWFNLCRLTLLNYLFVFFLLKPFAYYTKMIFQTAELSRHILPLSALITLRHKQVTHAFLCTHTIHLLETHNLHYYTFRRRLLSVYHSSFLLECSWLPLFSIPYGTNTRRRQGREQSAVRVLKSSRVVSYRLPIDVSIRRSLTSANLQ